MDTFAIESFVSFCDDMTIAEEGANLDARAKYKAFLKVYKTELKTAKSLIKQGEQKKAIPHLKKAKKSLEDTSKEINKCDSTVGSVVFGWITSKIPVIGRHLIATMTVGLEPVVNFTDLVERVIAIVRIAEKDPKGFHFDIEYLNGYKNGLRQKLMEYEKIIDAMIARCSN